jgi:hypothetical protein
LKLPGKPFGIDPIATTAQIKIVDLNASATETVSGVTPVISGGFCSLPITAVNSHQQGSYFLTSATCGLQEAINDLGTPNTTTNGGTVVVTQEFYQLGCNAATITGIANNLRSNVYVLDKSYGQNLWYTLQPSTLSALATPATRSATAGNTQVISGTAVGTWAASTYFVCVTYVDVLGGESPCSASFSFTATASVALNYASPAASTGAVGWRAYGGLTGTSTQYQLPITSTNCTLSTLTPYPACAIGAAGVFPTPTTATALAPGYVVNVYRPNTQSHTTFAFAPTGIPPNQGVGYQTHYGPFIATANVPAGNVAVLATVPLNTAVLNTIYRTIRVTGKVTSTPANTAAQTYAISLGPSFTTGTPTAICSTIGAALTAAAYNTVLSCTMTVNATGASGTIMPNGWSISQLAAGTTTSIATNVDTGTAAITDDLTGQQLLYVVLTSGTAATNPAQLLDLHIEYLN